MPRPPRRVPSKKTTASTARVTKPAAKTVAASTRPSTSGKRKSTDSTRPARKTSVEAAEDNTVKPPALKKRRVARGVVKNGSSAPHLVARKKKILLEEIDTKWVNLSESSVAELSKLLRDVGRAVLSDMPLKSASKREEAQKTLEKSYQRFERSLAKVKIPPGSSEKVFNNEWLINEEARINALIQPEARQINMLQKELAKQRRLLETEERQLLTLQKNAKAEKEVRRQKALKFIPALKAPPMDPDQLQLEIDKIRLNSDKSESDFTIARDLLKEDEGLLPTMTQLEKHLTSIAKNRQALGAIPEWIQSTRAAVDDVLYNLKGDRYADLMDLSV
ncbi:hypothetical protein TWF106_007863 [Orbilia oligospora]|uniref:Uncharacterized protein n=1 Tax=Orbilia oligospora TaxID=2813651 RepID=A0A7C8PP15_ORBOL|nr:hypothetical protein TWF788_000638 [Orbilia oligospora]KAF3211240.1 hypothetical protein TWF191_010818 [Orbilia oligospora]KAF3217555.1 hypothetical protein TWF106_007863 [Orbilia oligospora]